MNNETKSVYDHMLVTLIKVGALDEDKYEDELRKYNEADDDTKNYLFLSNVDFISGMLYNSI